jgi:hypothetical protein
VEAFVITSVRRQGLAIVMGALVLAAAPASAQELSLGYQWQRFSFSVADFDEGDDSLTAPLGFNIDFAGPITPTLDVVGQVDWSRWSESEVIFGTSVEANANFTTFGGGIRWSSRTNPSATPFVHALFGATRASVGCDVAGFDCEDFLGSDTSATDPMFQIGGGVAVPMGAWSALGQLDYRRIFAEDEGVNSFRIVLGVRLAIR